MPDWMMPLVFCWRWRWLVLALATTLTARSQSLAPRLDSLRAVLRQPRLADSSRVVTITKLSQLLSYNDLEASRRYAEQGQALAHRLGRVRDELQCLNLLGDLALTHSNYLEAARLRQQLLRRANEVPLPQGQAFVLAALRGLGNIALDEGDLPTAGKFYRQMLAWADEHPQTPGVVRAVYFSMAQFYAMLLARPAPPDSLPRRTRQATYYAKQLLRVTRTAPVPAMTGMALMTLSRVALLRPHPRPDSAMLLMRQSVRQFELAHGVLDVATAQQNLAALEGQQQHYAAGVALARRALATARAYQAPGLQRDCYKTLGECLLALGQGNEAYRAATAAAALNDSLLNSEKVQALGRMEVLLQTTQQESQIRALRQQRHLQQATADRQRQRLLALVVGLLAVGAGLAAAAALALRLRRSQAQLAAQNEALQQARATQNRLYALIAHDLRAPVVAFSGLADLLNRHVLAQDTTRLAGLGGHIRQAAQNLSELLDNLLNWALSQRDELLPQPVPLPVGLLLRETAALYQAAAEAADVALTLTAPPDLRVLADPQMTRTILRNLVGNALRATPAGGTVALGAEAAGTGTVRLWVRDSGRGLNPQVLAQLAAPAGQLRVAEGQSGSGLGLLLSRRFAELQRGQLTLANLSAGGVGATLTLPASD